MLAAFGTCLDIGGLRFTACMLKMTYQRQVNSDGFLRVDDGLWCAATHSAPNNARSRI
ncbi:hypothetical protein MOLA814_01133 [Betaproteobacteria bacterium MOLA814]|jgi:hypothetical protein|nr:hypothetical protein MOLA814_01133 [Betaproteobacteria bacterium MOLA814]